MSRRTRRRLAYTAGNGFGAAGGTPARQPARTPALASAIPSTKHKAEVSDTDLDPDISDRSAGVPPAVAGASRLPPTRGAQLVATFFGVGRLRPGAGTWASGAPVVLWWLISRWSCAYWQCWTANQLSL